MSIFEIFGLFGKIIIPQFLRNIKGKDKYIFVCVKNNPSVSFADSSLYTKEPFGYSFYQ